MSTENYTIATSRSSIRFCIPYRKYRNLILVQIIKSLILPGIIVLASLDGFIPFQILLIWFFPFILIFSIDLLWLLFGKEIVTIDRNSITIKHHIFGLGFSRKFTSDKTNGVFISQKNYDELENIRDIKFVNFKIGRIAFNYGKSILGEIYTIRFGSNLEEWEARDIVKIIHERFPRYIYFSPEKTG